MAATVPRNPKVSIVVPFFNASRFIESAVQTIRAQTHSNFEAIFIDDCSSDDGSEHFVRLVGSDSRFTMLRQDLNSGPSNCRNLGIAHATGEYIAFLDVDDEWYPEKLAMQLLDMIATGAGFSCTRYRHMSNDGTRVGLPVYVPRRITFMRHAIIRFIGCSTVMIRRDILRSSNVFPGLEKAMRNEDFLAWAALLKVGIEAVGCQRVLCRYRLAKNSRSSNFWGSAENMRRNVEHLFLDQPLMFASTMVGYYVSATIKRMVCYPLFNRARVIE